MLITSFWNSTNNVILKESQKIYEPLNEAKGRVEGLVNFEVLF